MKRRVACLVSIAAAVSTMSAPSAEAAVVVTFTEVGSDVLENGSGTINLNGLTFLADVFTEPAVIEPSQSYVISGSTLGLTAIYEGAIAGPTNFGLGGSTFASSGSGDTFGINPSDGSFFLYVPDSYFGGQLSTSSTFLNASFASLGMMPGTYVYSFGSGTNGDRVFIDVGTNTIPEPSTWAMMLLGFAGLGFAGYRARGRLSSPSCSLG